jgi:hypothetical protein
MDPRIRIRTKMSRIPNTGKKVTFSFLLLIFCPPLHPPPPSPRCCNKKLALDLGSMNPGRQHLYRLYTRPIIALIPQETRWFFQD